MITPLTRREAIWWTMCAVPAVGPALTRSAFAADTVARLVVIVSAYYAESTLSADARNAVLAEVARIVAAPG